MAARACRTFQCFQLAAILLCLFPISRAECENACSGHGLCAVYDMCICQRNWQGNDCSERLCEFGPAFVDTPKGDLDSSDSIGGPDDILVENSLTYPYGTTEQFPTMRDSDNQQLYQTAHEYAECSNAGVCNRQSGECECFPGFEGAACQRMPCPGEDRECSGHGICQSLKEVARKNDHSEYKLWDKDLLHSCLCDPGFYGRDCSLRSCKHGLDPLYLDDIGTVQIPSFFVGIFSTSQSFDLSASFSEPGTGYFRMRIFDEFGESWLTRPIQVRASCAQLVDALENIPHRAIPSGRTVCFKSSFTETNPLNPNTGDFTISYEGLYKQYFSGTKTYDLITYPAIQDFGYSSSYQNFSHVTSDLFLTGDLYLLQMFGNIGTFQQPKINAYLVDGNRPSLVSRNGSLVARTWTNGMQSENIDYFADQCGEIRVQVKESEGQWFFWGQSYTIEELAACIGTSDHDDSNNVFINDQIEWDYGSPQNPHVIRLKRNTGDERDGGWYCAFYFDTDVNDFDAGVGVRTSGGFAGALRILHPFRSLEGNDDTQFSVYTTNGTVSVAGNQSEAVFDFGVNVIYTTNTSYDLHAHSYDGEVSCEARGFTPGDESDRSDCLDKNDLFFLIDPINTMANPSFLNMYTAKSIRRIRDSKLNTIGREYRGFDGLTLSPGVANITSRYRKNVIITDLHTNWAQDASASGQVHVYKFAPDEDSSYHYVSECSNRGICNTFEGICECFHGYTGADCATQDTITQ